MSIKVPVTNLTNLANETSAVNTINANINSLADAIDLLLSRDGEAPNSMEGDLDANSNRILNLPAPTSSTEPARWGDIEEVFTEAVDARDIAVVAASAAQEAADRVDLGALDEAIEITTENKDIVSAAAITATGAATTATTAANTATLAANNAFINANIYPGISTGLAAVSNGQQFQVLVGSEYVRYRRDTASTYTEMGRYPSVDTFATVLGVERDQPNLFTKDELAFTDTSRISIAGTTPTTTLVNVDDLPSLKLEIGAGGITSQYRWVFPRSAFGDAQNISASLRVMAADANPGGTGQARFLIQQYNGSSEITAARGEINIAANGAITSPKVFSFSGIEINENTTRVDFNIAISTSGASSGRSITFREMMIATGTNQVFRAPPLKLPEVQAVSYLPDMDFSGLNPSGSAPWTGGNASIIFEDGVPTLSMGGVAQNYRSYSIPASGKLAPGNVVQVMAEVFSDKASGVEIGMIFRNSSGTEVGTRKVVVNSTINAWEVLRAAQTVPATTETIQVRLVMWEAAQSATVGKFRWPALLSGDYEVPVKNTFVVTSGGGSGASGHATVYVATTGNDTTGTGSAANPYATIGKALDALGGVGDVIVKPGLYTHQVNVGLIRDVSIIGDMTSDLARPLFRYGTKLSGITKTSGYTKVYQSTISLSGQPNMIWQDGVADEETEVPTAEQHFGLKGRGFRLPCVKIEKTTEDTTLATALTEIDGASDPRCFYQGGVLYFSIQGGGDATGANIYVSTNTSAGLFTSLPSFWTPGGIARVSGIDVRYGGFNGRAFRKSWWHDCSALGAAVNGFDLAWWHQVLMCEAMGSGSGVTNNGDGFNWHSMSECEYSGLYSHDNWDDGESAHENCRVIGRNSIMEYNRGTGCAPAYGAHAIYHGMLTRKNSVHARLPSGKMGGIQCLGAPIVGEDDGVATTCEVYDSVSIGDLSGFIDATPGATPAFLKAYRCTAIDPVEYGYKCSEIYDCRHSGAGTAKTGDTSVYNSTIVT